MLAGTAAPSTNAPQATGYRRHLRHLPWLAGAVAAGLAAKNLIGVYADFGIYLDVAREFVAGGIDIHRERTGSGPFVYPHAAALPFVLLHELLGDTGARWAWSLLLGLATVWLLRAAARCVEPFGGLQWWQWLVFGVLFQRCIAQNLTHGQLSLWVGTFVVAGSAALVHGRDARAGVWLGLAAALKLTPALFLVALPFFGRTRAAVVMLATIGVVVFLLPWPICGTAEHVRHLQTLAATLHESLTAPEHAAITQTYAGPSIRGALDYLLQPRSPGENGRTVNLFDVSDATLRAVRIGWSAVLATLFAAWCWRARTLPTPQRLAHQVAAVALMQCLFAPLLRTYHLAAAIVPFVLFCRGPRGKRDVLWFAAAFVFLFTLTLRQKKLLGETLWRVLDGGAALHLGLVLMILWLVRDAGARNDRP